MEIIDLIKRISIFTGVPVLMALFIIGLLKLLVPALQKLSDKSFQVIDKQAGQPKSTGWYDKFALVSFKVMIGYIIFIVFLQMFSLPLYFMPMLKWEPPAMIVLLCAIVAMLFSGLITYKLMRVVNKNFIHNTRA
jgi:hypothetical protein